MWILFGALFRMHVEMEFDKNIQCCATTTHLDVLKAKR